MKKEEILKLYPEPYKQVSAYFPGKVISCIEPVFLDNTRVWKEMNKRNSAFYGNFFLSGNTKIVVTNNGIDYVVDKQTTKEILFQKLKGFYGVEQLQDPNIKITALGTLFDANEFVRVYWVNNVMTIKKLDGTTLMTYTFTKRGSQAITNGGYTITVDLLKIPTGTFDYVIDRNGKVYIYVPAVSGVDVTRDVRKTLSGIDFQFNEFEIVKLVASSQYYTFYDADGNLILQVDRGNGSFNSPKGKIIISSGISNGTYYLDTDAFLYTFIPGTGSTSETVLENKQLEYIGFPTDDGKIYKVVVANFITVYEFTSGQWVSKFQKLNFPGELNGLVTLQVLPVGDYFVDHQFNILKNVNEMAGTFNRLPFLYFNADTDELYLKIKLVYSAYDYPEYFVKVGESWYSLGKMNSYDQQQTTALGSSGVSVDWRNIDVPVTKVDVINLIDKYFAYSKTHGNVIFEYEILPNGTLIDVLTVPTVETVNIQVPVESETKVVGADETKYPSGLKKIKVTYYGVNDVFVTVYDAVSGKAVAYGNPLNVAGTYTLTDGSSFVIAEPYVFDANHTPHEITVDSQNNLVNVTLPGLKEVKKKFPYGDIQVIEDLFKSGSYFKLKVLIENVGKMGNNNIRVVLYDLGGTYLDELTVDTQNYKLSQLSLFGFIWNGKVLQGSEEYIIDKYDYLYSMSQEDYTIETVNRKFDYLDIEWGTYDGDKIIKLEKTDDGIKLYLDGDDLGLFPVSGIIEEGDATFELTNNQALPSDLYLDEDCNILELKPAEIVPAHNKLSSENENIVITWFKQDECSNRLFLHLVKGRETGKIYFYVVDIDNNYRVIEQHEITLTGVVGQKVSTQNIKFFFNSLIDWNTFDQIKIVINKQYEEIEVTHKTQMSMSYQGWTSLDNDDNYKEYIVQDWVGASGEKWDFSINPLKSSDKWVESIAIAPYSIIESLGVIGGVPPLYANIVSGRTALIGASSLKVFKGGRFYKPKISTTEKTMSEMGVEWGTKPTQSGYVISTVGNYVLAANGIQDYAWFVYSATDINAKANPYGGSNNTGLTALPALNGTIKLLQNYHTYFRPVVFWYDHVNDKCYELQAGEPVYVSDDVNYSVTGNIEIAAVNQSEELVNVTESVISYTSAPEFTNIMEPNPEYSPDLVVTPVTEPGTEERVTGEFTYNLVFIEGGEMTFDFDKTERVVITPGVPDSYEPLIQSETINEGAQAAKLIPVTQSGELSGSVTDMNGNITDLSGEQSGTLFTIPAFQFNGYFIEFD